MFVSTLLVAIVALAGFSGASDAPAYGRFAPKYVPIQLVADPLLDQLGSSLDNLESREAGQLSRLDVLIKEANKNTEFVNKFNEVILANFEFEQKQQNQRLDDLEAKIAEIQALRVRAQNLQAAGSAINDQINNVVYPDRKKIMYDISDLQNIALEQNSQIQDTQQRADDVNDRIDALVAKAWDNTRALLVLDAARKDVTQGVNVQILFGPGTVTLQPNTENSTVSWIDESLGAPQSTGVSLIGFHAVKERSYKYGYPSIYFGVSRCLGATGILGSSVDMSSGGWVTESITAQFADCYISTDKLSLK